MKQEEIKFAKYSIIADSKFRNIQPIEMINLIKMDQQPEYDGAYYQLSGIEAVDERYVWFYFSYGKHLPYGDHVLDIADQKKVSKNPKKEDKIEQNRQLFIVYDQDDSMIYLSNSKQKKFVESYLANVLKYTINLQQHFITPEQFAEQITKINSVKLVAPRNLLSTASGLFTDKLDPLGLGDPEEAVLELKYKSPIKFNRLTLIKYLHEFITQKKQKQIDSLIVIGENDNHISGVFNLETLSSSIVIKHYKNNHGMYDHAKIKELFFNRLLDDKKN